jgi:hypothetical protein
MPDGTTATCRNLYKVRATTKIIKRRLMHMALQAFTRNYADNSTEEGFQFTFYCDLCGDGFKTKFIESKSYRKGQLFRNVGRVISTGASLLGKYNIGYNIERGSDIITERFQGMTPEWHKEHEAAFELAQNEAQSNFHRCPKCKRWVCEMDWNEQEGLCVEDAPRVNVEIASARAEKMAADIREKLSIPKFSPESSKANKQFVTNAASRQVKASFAITAVPAWQ